MSAKNKTLLFVSTVFLIFISTIVGVVVYDQSEKLEFTKREFQTSINGSYSKILARHKEFYYNRVMANLGSSGVVDAFAKRDRDTLYRLTRGRWDALKHENEHLTVMHFHLPDGTSFLRMHEPNRYGDDIASLRPMAASIHKNQKVLYGFEAGVFNLAYRIFVPVFKDEKYIGALEFGSRPDHLLREMEYLNSLKGALFVKNDRLHLYKESQTIVLKDYTLQYDTLQNDDILRYLQQIEYDFSSPKTVEYDGFTYNLYVFDLYDFAGKTSAKVLFMQDISSVQNSFWTTIYKLLVLSVGLFLLVVIIINIGFKKILSVLDDANKRLLQNRSFLSSVLDNSPFAVIATDKSGVISLFNQKAQKLLGYSPAEIVGVATPKRFHKYSEVVEAAAKLSGEFGGSVEPGFAVFRMRSDAGLENEGDWTYVAKDGSEIPVHLRITTILDENGQPSGYLGFAEDITNKKRIEAVLKEQKEELEAILSTSIDGVAILDLQTNFLYANDAYLAMTEFSMEELRQKSCAELSAPEDIKRAKAAIEEVLRVGHIENFEKTCIVNGGKRVAVNMSIALMPDRERLLITTKNVTEQKRVARQVADYVRLVDENVITSSTDLDGNITYASEAFCKISEYKKEELIGTNHRIIRHPDMQKQFFEEMWNTLSADGVWSGEIKNLKKGGGFYWIKTSIYPIFDELGVKVGYTAIRQDITDKKLVEELSVTDGLTGIHNRRKFNEICPSFISADRMGAFGALAILDIDHFKLYNDTYGHQMGDEALARVAKVLKEFALEGEWCFRMGGEEFAMLLCVSSVEDAKSRCEELTRRVVRLAIPHEKNSTHKFVTLSVGAVVIKNSPSCDDAYKTADALLYGSKEGGRNTVSVGEL